MLRRTLDITERVTIPLSDELEFVSNYLQVEQKRFSKPISVDVIVDEGIDCDTVMVLSMKIQIPVENAIKHAFEPNEEDKRLTISITKEKNQALLLIVKDNGRGYHPSTNTVTKGSGLGLRVLEQSIRWLNAKNQQKISMVVQNRTDGKGTEVLITIPRVYSFELENA